VFSTVSFDNSHTASNDRQNLQVDDLVTMKECQVWEVVGQQMIPLGRLYTLYSSEKFPKVC
jgi:hypothetical protein